MSKSLSGRNFGFLLQLSVLATTLIVFSLALENALFSAEFSQQRLEVFEKSSTARSSLDADLVELIQIIRGIKVAIEVDPALSQNRFEIVAERITSDLPGLLGVSVAPNMVIEKVYPWEELRSLVGFDYRSSDDQGTSAEAALRSDHAVIVAPVDLIQGGVGVISRIAIRPLDYQGDGTSLERSAETPAWGIASIAIDRDKILANTIRSLEESKLSAAIRNRLGESGSSEPIFGDPGLFETDSVILDVPLPNGYWQIAVRPVAGWITTSSQFHLIWMTTAAIGLTLGIVLFFLRRYRQLQTAAEKRLDAAFMAIDDGFALYDTEDRLVVCNDTYRSYYPKTAHLLEKGVPFETLVREAVKTGMHPDAIGREEVWIESRLAAHRAANSTVLHKMDNGRWLRVVDKRLDDGCIICSRVDITPLMDAREAAEKSDRTKTLFLNKISHELRTPLSVILGYISFLEHPDKLASTAKILESGKHDAAEAEFASGEVMAEISRYATKIRASALQLLNTIDKLLDFSELQTEIHINEEQDVCLSEMIEAVVDNYRQEAATRNTKIETPETTSPIIRTSPNTLMKALNCVIRHCCETLSNGTLKVKISDSPKSAVIVFEVEGHIDKTRIESHLFTRGEESLDETEVEPLSLDLGIAKKLIATVSGVFEYGQKSKTTELVSLTLFKSEQSSGSSAKSFDRVQAAKIADEIDVEN